MNITEMYLTAVFLFILSGYLFAYAKKSPKEVLAANSADLNLNVDDAPEALNDEVSSSFSVTHINEGRIFFYVYNKAKKVRRVFVPFSSFDGLKRTELKSISTEEYKNRFNAEQSAKNEVILLIQSKNIQNVSESGFSDEEIQTQPLAEFSGRVKKWGFDVFPHQVAGAPATKSFYLELDIQGKAKRIWGVDLSRAIKEAKAEIGSMVRVMKFPKESVVVDGGKTVVKNKFSIKVA